MFWKLFIFIIVLAIVEFYFGKCSTPFHNFFRIIGHWKCCPKIIPPKFFPAEIFPPKLETVVRIFLRRSFPAKFFPRSVLVNKISKNNSPCLRFSIFVRPLYFLSPPPYKSICVRCRGHRICYSKFIYDSLTSLLTFFSNLIFGPEMALKVVFGIFSGINFRGVLFSRIFKNPNFRGVLFSRFCQIRENKAPRKLIPAKINPREN